MLTAHTRILIRKNLPEVVDVYVRDDSDVVALSIIRLRLADGSELAIVEQCGETRVWRSRLRDDYSDLVDVLTIETDLRRRLVLVFGEMTFRDPQ